MTQEQKTRIEEHHDRLYHIATVDNIPDDIRDALKAAYLAGAAYALDIYCPHWISIEDSLPKEHQWFLGYSPMKSAMLVDVYNFDSNGLIEAHCITHWMPLPSVEHLKDK